MSHVSAVLSEHPRGFVPAPVLEVDYDLLPPNATPFERALAKSMARINEIPVDIHKLRNADLCPVQFLPYLAWELAVDGWHSGLTTQQKRDLIRVALENHRIKGTPRAIRQALDATGIDVDLIEWHQTEPMGTPGTFKALIRLKEPGEQGIASAFQAGEALKLIDRTKRFSAHYEMDVEAKVSNASTISVAGAPSTRLKQSGDLTFTHEASSDRSAALAAAVTTRFFQKGTL